MSELTDGEYRKYRKQVGPGKGDKSRISDLQRFRDNYGSIKWNHDKFRKSKSRKRMDE